MKTRPADYLYIFLTIALTVYGQLIVKWRVTALGFGNGASNDHVKMLMRLLTDPYVLSGLCGAFLAAMCWMIALSKFQLSYAYPFTSLSFVAVLLLSAYLLKEPLSITRMAGVGLIVLGTIVAARG
jgi:drug/metabolite transporter (DMT)-like permease